MFYALPIVSKGAVNYKLEEVSLPICTLKMQLTNVTFYFLTHCKM